MSVLMGFSTCLYQFSTGSVLKVWRLRLYHSAINKEQHSARTMRIGYYLMRTVGLAITWKCVSIFM